MTRRRVIDRIFNLDTLRGNSTGWNIGVGLLAIAWAIVFFAMQAHGDTE